MKKLLKFLKEHKLTLGSVESMTGGKFAAKFTDIPGSSSVFKGSIISYCSEIKESIVGVNPKTIEKFGVVSKEVAEEMAKKGRKLLNVDICVSVTGNAGPTCEPGGKPAGYYCIGLSCKKGTFSKTIQVHKKRNGVRNSAILAMREFIYSKSI